VNVIISKRDTSEVIVRYEVHLARGDDVPPEQAYFDDAWRRAVSDRLVEPAHRDAYEFQLQRPMNLYQSSR
jgi:hypothetical protein